MSRHLWTYYAPEEVASAVEHIDILVARGVAPETAAADAAAIYRKRTGDYRTPFVRGHLATQWRVKYRADLDDRFGPPRNRPERRPSKYPTEVSFRAFFHRLFRE